MTGALVNMSELARLQQARGYPMISLLSPVDVSDPDGTRRRLGRLADHALARLREEFDDAQCARIEPRLRVAIDDAAAAQRGASVAVFVGGGDEDGDADGDEVTITPLPVEVRERVVIDETFATRDLLRALHRSVHYLVLNLHPRVTRLFEGTGPELREVHRDGFPVTVPAPDDSPRRGRSERSDRQRREQLRYGKVVTSLLTPALHRQHEFVVLVGARARQASVRSQTPIAGNRFVAGPEPAVEFPDLLALGEQVWPLARQRHDATVERQLESFRSSGPGQRWASGIDDVWQLARQGRGDVLLIEETFEYPALVEARTGQTASAAARDAPGVVDDLVDELIEVVTAKRGWTYFVPDDALADFGRVALKVRY